MEFDAAWMTVDSESDEASEDEGQPLDKASCVMNQSPGKTKFWTPYCDDTLKSYCGQEFKTLEIGIRFYKDYAAVAGFDVRCSTGRRDRWGEVELKYLLCPREGKKATANGTVNLGLDNIVDKQETRKKTSNRVGCMARVILKQAANGAFIVHKMVEEHTHCLCSDVGRPFLKVNRKLDLLHQTFIAHGARANIGTSNTFKLCKEMAGSYGNVGATTVEFYNFKRDLHAFLVAGDAQMLIDMFDKRREVTPELSFAYDVDEENHLRRIFWADSDAKKQYSCFGAVVSFDATYRTNRYNMVFVPFTGVDNHKHCVTFAARLLTKEDMASYVWLLKRFMEAMGGAPACVITDEDPTMKIAIAEIHPKTAHRFCTWHIMTKLTEKIGTDLAKDETFRKRLNAIVWDETIGVDEFESRWQEMIKEYNLGENRWFKKFFDIRANWISEYFSRIKMGGMLQTTSRSEAINGVFGKITNRHACLMDFFGLFEGGIEAQRYKQAKLNAECESSIPTLKTPLKIEKQASTLYTITIFYDMQKEICASCFSCHVRGSHCTEDATVFHIEESGGSRYEVKLHITNKCAKCSCKLFERVGILCRHVFVVYKEVGIQTILAHYVVGRWTRNAFSQPIHTHTIEGGRIDAVEDDQEYVAAKVMNEFFQCIALARMDREEKRDMWKLIENHKVKLQERRGLGNLTQGKEDAVQSFYGTPALTTIIVLPPVAAKNKGIGKRLKSMRERAAETSVKAKRLCRKCKENSHHDSCTCPRD